MKTFTVITMGCKVNQYESDALSGQLENLGWQPSASGKDAELIIINTCTVTGKASMQARQAIRRAIRLSPGAKIVATGCYAQAAPGEIEKIPGVDAIIGQADKHRIPELLPPSGTAASPSPSRMCRDISRERHFHLNETPVFGNRTRPFLKIQDGCNAFCTYCIVPYTRGRSRSMHPDDVLEHLKALVAGGRLEVVLTGIHLGCYGADLDPATSLEELLFRIDTARAVRRVRLSSIEPHELTQGIIECVATSDRFCRHFHIPLQSGDPGVLHRMRRPYTEEFFKKLVWCIHSRMPDAAIGVDILVGFPGETGDAFDRTYSLIESLPVTYLHVFPFSARPGTPAAGYDDPVPVDVIKARSRRLRQLGNRKKRQFFEPFLGKDLEILVEETRDAVSGLLKGISSNYGVVLVTGEDHLKNTLVTARIDKFRADSSLLGTVCDP